MSDYITLLGAEDVQRAASTMREAADNMQRAADSIDYSLHQALNRFEEQIERLAVITGAQE